MKSLFESWYKVGIKAQFRWQATGFSRGTDPILSHPLKIKWWQWWSMIKSLNMMITYSECCSRPGCCSSYTEISFCPYFSPKEISHCSWLVALCAPTLLLRQNLLHCIIGTSRVLHWAAHNVILEQTCMFDFESLQFIGGMNVGLCQGQKLKSTVLDSQKPDCTSLALSPSLELCCPHWASPACKARSRPNRGKQGPNRGRYISNARSPPLFTKNITIHILAKKNPPLPFLLKTEFS